ncbi:DUF4907 domain-containing protein [Longitalea arenae]|uniref:DUF4907 domain-containing protein n=1 Tax=Longitalea arenae TaxID=2812558 RepID=UPI001966DD98|nr:DUF4907 domain-containing protein [Longitalea arenae]
MTISKKHKLVLLAAILFAAGSTFFMLVLKPAEPKGLHYSCFKTERGWGYDVLFNERIIIHQPFIPGKSGGDGFATKEQAATVAKTVIESIKSGNDPLFGRPPLQRRADSGAHAK